MDGKQLMMKMGKGGGPGKKQKGLPKRHRNSIKKMRAQRSLDKLPEKKARHILKRNGVKALRQYEIDGFIPNTIVKRVCAAKRITPPE